MSKGKINLAAVARTNDISYQRLLKKVKAGIPLSTAIDECLIAREASISPALARTEAAGAGTYHLAWHNLCYICRRLSRNWDQSFHRLCTSAAGLLQTNDYQ